MTREHVFTHTKHEVQHFEQWKQKIPNDVAVCSPLLLGEWQRINKIGLGHLFSFDFQITFGRKGFSI